MVPCPLSPRPSRSPNQSQRPEWRRNPSRANASSALATLGATISQARRRPVGRPVKAGVGITGRPVGHARAPLIDPTAEHVAELKAIIESGLALVAREKV